jgi:hypothetical protein
VQGVSRGGYQRLLRAGSLQGVIEPCRESSGGSLTVMPIDGPVIIIGYQRIRSFIIECGN